MDRLYFDANLPDFPPNPTITLHRRQLEEFRAAYKELLMFAATMCGKPLNKLTAGDAVARLPEPDVMSAEQLQYWSSHPAYLSWTVLVEMKDWDS